MSDVAGFVVPVPAGSCQGHGAEPVIPEAQRGLLAFESPEAEEDSTRISARLFAALQTFSVDVLNQD